MTMMIPGTHGSYAPGSNGLEGYSDYTAPTTNTDNTDNSDPFSNVQYGSGLDLSGNSLYGQTDFGSNTTGSNVDWGYTPDFGSSLQSFDNYMGGNDYGLSYDGSSFAPTEAYASANAGWPYEVSNNSDYSSNDPWERLKQAAGDYNSFMSNPYVKGANTLLGATGNAIPGLGYVNLASNAIQNPTGTAVGLGGALAQSALLGPIGGLMSMFGVNLPKMGYDYLNNSYMGEPRYGATAADQQAAQNAGNSAMSGALQSGLSLGSGLMDLYGGLQASRSAGNVASNLGNMYSNNSPYAQQLRQELARKDAAAGRRSQYGTREVELQAKLAQMATQASGAQLAAQQQKYQQYMSMANSLGKLSQLYPQISRGLSGLSGLFGGSQTPSLDLGNIYGSGASPSYGFNTGFLDSGVGNSGYDVGGW